MAPWILQCVAALTLVSHLCSAESVERRVALEGGAAFCPAEGPGKLIVSGGDSASWNGSSLAVQGSSANATWELPTSTVSVSPGSQVALSCLTISNVSLAPASITSFGRPTLLLLTPPGAGQPPPLWLSRVTLVTRCTTVRQYQQFFGRMNMTFLAGAVEVSSPTWLFVYSWQTPTVTLANVNITCSPAAPAAGAAAAALFPPCLATAVSDAPSLMAAVDRLQRQQGPPASQLLPVIVVLRQDITFAQSDVAPFWPKGQSITGNVTLAAVLSQNVVVDFNDIITIWNLLPPQSHLTLSGFSLINMPTSYVAPSLVRPASLLGMLETSVLSVNRLATNPPRFFMQSLTLVIAYDEFAFWSYWVSLGLSPTPAVAQLASWSKFRAVQGGSSDVNRVRLVDTVALLSSWANLTLANPVVHPLLDNLTGLLGLTNLNGVQVFTPPSAYFQVKSLQNIAFAVNYTVGDFWSQQFGQCILLCANVSGNTPADQTNSTIFPPLLYAAALPAGTPPPAGPAGSEQLALSAALAAAAMPPAPPPPPSVNTTGLNSLPLPAVLQVATTVMTWPDGHVCWDAQLAPLLLTFSTTAQLTLRNLSLMNFPPSTSANVSGADPITQLASGMWSFPNRLDSGSLASILNLNAITLYVPPAELNLFLSAASLPLPAGARPLTAAGQAIMQRFVPSQQVSSYGATWIYYTSLGTLRFQGTDVNLTSTVPPACSDYAAMPVYASYSAFTSSSQAAASSSGATSSSAFPAWAIAVVATVAGVAVLGAVLVVLLLGRSRRRQRLKDADAKAAEALAAAAIHANGANGRGVVMLSCAEDKNFIIDSFSFSGSAAGMCGPNMIDGPCEPGSGNPSGRLDPEVMIAQMALKNTGMRDEQLHIFGVLGRGGHGIVYRASWKGLPVAAKVMIVHEERHEQARHQMLEATISTSLHHPNIVTTYSYDLKRLATTSNNPLCFSTPNASGNGVSSGSSSILFAGATAWQLLIVQELCSGGTMRQVIDDKQLCNAKGPPTCGDANLEHVLQLALDVALGLEHLHSKNVVHSDMTPNNVLLQATLEPRAAGLLWVAKVADFGLSVAFEEGKSHMSRVFAGTPYYIAPETQNEGILSKASDVFAFGILLLEMVTGPPRKPDQTSQAPLSALPPRALHKFSSVTDSAIDGNEGDSPTDSHRASTSTSSIRHSTPTGTAIGTATGTATPTGAGTGTAGRADVTLLLTAAASPTAAKAADLQDVSSSSTAALATGEYVPGLVSTQSLSSTNSAQPLLLGGGGGSYGAARALPPLPLSCPPQYCALVTDCLNPNPAKRPTITVVGRRLRMLAAEHVPGLQSMASGISSGRAQSLISGDSGGAALLSAASLDAATRAVHSICEESSYM